MLSLFAVYRVVATRVSFLFAANGKPEVTFVKTKEFVKVPVCRRPDRKSQVGPLCSVNRSLSDSLAETSHSIPVRFLQ